MRDDQCVVCGESLPASTATDTNHFDVKYCPDCDIIMLDTRLESDFARLAHGETRGSVFPRVTADDVADQTLEDLADEMGVTGDVEFGLAPDAVEELGMDKQEALERDDVTVLPGDMADDADDADVDKSGASGDYENVWDAFNQEEAAKIRRGETEFNPEDYRGFEGKVAVEVDAATDRCLYVAEDPESWEIDVPTTAPEVRETAPSLFEGPDSETPGTDTQVLVNPVFEVEPPEDDEAMREKWNERFPETQF